MSCIHSQAIQTARKRPRRLGPTIPDTGGGVHLLHFPGLFPTRLVSGFIEAAVAFVVWIEGICKTKSICISIDLPIKVSQTYRKLNQ